MDPNLVNLIQTNLQIVRNDFYHRDLGPFTDKSTFIVHMIVYPFVQQLSQMSISDLLTFFRENLSESNLSNEIESSVQREDYVQTLNTVLSALIQEVLYSSARVNSYTDIFDPYNILRRVKLWGIPILRRYLPQFPYGSSVRSGSRIGNHPTSIGFEEALQDYLNAVPIEFRARVSGIVRDYFQTFPGNQELDFFDLFNLLQKLR